MTHSESNWIINHYAVLFSSLVWEAAAKVRSFYSIFQNYFWKFLTYFFDANLQDNIPGFCCQYFPLFCLSLCINKWPKPLINCAFQMNRCSQKRVQNKGVFFVSPNLKSKFFTLFSATRCLRIDMVVIIEEIFFEENLTATKIPGLRSINVRLNRGWIENRRSQSLLLTAWWFFSNSSISTVVVSVCELLTSLRLCDSAVK